MDTVTYKKLTLMTGDFDILFKVRLAEFDGGSVLIEVTNAGGHFAQTAFDTKKEANAWVRGFACAKQCEISDFDPKTGK